MKPIRLVLVVLLLSACSGTTFVYNRLHLIIPWFVDDYVELSRPQKESLDNLLAPVLGWHRQEELPKYLLLLQEVESGLDSPASANTVAAVFEEFEAAFKRLEGVSTDWMLSLGEQLSDEQLEEFLANNRKRQTEYEEEYLTRSEEKYREDIYDNFVDSYQDFLGRLNREQRAAVRETAQKFQRSDALWLRERAAWLDQLEVLLQREPGWQDQLRAALEARESRASEEYLATYDHNMNLLFADIAQTLNSRTQRQDRRLRKKLSSLQEDLQSLIAKGQG